LRLQVTEREDALVDLAAELELARNEARHFRGAAAEAEAAAAAAAQAGARRPSSSRGGGAWDQAGAYAEAGADAEAGPAAEAAEREAAAAEAAEREALLMAHLAEARAELAARDAALTALTQEVGALQAGEGPGAGTLYGAGAADCTEGPRAQGPQPARGARLSGAAAAAVELQAERARAAVLEEVVVQLTAALAHTRQQRGPASSAAGGAAAPAEARPRGAEAVGLAAELERQRLLADQREAEVGRLQDAVTQLQNAMLQWQTAPTAHAGGAEGSAAAEALAFRDELIARLSGEAERLRQRLREREGAEWELRRQLQAAGAAAAAAGSATACGDGSGAAAGGRDLAARASAAAAEADRMREEAVGAKAAAAAAAAQHEEELAAVRALLLEMQQEVVARDAEVEELQGRLELRAGAGYARTEEVRVQVMGVRARLSGARGMRLLVRALAPNPSLGRQCRRRLVLLAPPKQA
jgi:hypothetical protein